jgi:hypothetical protein
MAGVDFFWNLLSASNRDKDRIGEFVIGTNPGVTEPIEYISLDKKIRGSVQINFGINERFGSKTYRTCFDLEILKPAICLDD